MKEQQTDAESVRERIEDSKRDLNKKLAQIYRELEKQQLSLDRRITTEEFNERLETKADK